MVCKEEVFEWFKELSGAKRIELMCGLMSMCIPLEIRFFKSCIEESAKINMNALREAEQKANAFLEMDTICKCDLLADIPINETNDLKPNVTNCEMQSIQSNIQTNAIQSNCSHNSVNQSIPQPLHQSSQTTIPVMPMQDMTGVSANGTAVMAPNDIIVPPQHPPPSSPQLAQLPSRSKLIISMCLLSPTNRNCSASAYKALRHQLTAHHIGTVVSNFLKYGHHHLYELEDMFSGIRLLLTLAVYHPAFTYEQREQLTKQKEEVERTIELFNPHFRQNPNYSGNAHPFQTYGPHQTVHTPPTSHIHGHMGPHQTQAHTQSVGVNAGGTTAHSHSHSHVNVGQMSGPVPTHPTGQYAAHPYIPQMPVTVTNMTYTTPLPNISNLRVSSMTSPVSTPSPTSSPSSSKTVTSVAAISPLPITAEFMAHNIHTLAEAAQNQSPYVLTTGIPPHPHQTLSDEGGSGGVSGGCAKNIISCYNCGSIGHRGDDCRTQNQEEANR